MPENEGTTQQTDKAPTADKTDATAAATSSATANTNGRAETATPWDELGGYEDVKKRLEHARTWEKRAKENTDAAKRLAEIEESQKTETQKLTERLTAAEKELAAHRVRDIRAQAAREAGLDAEMAQFLTESEPDAALAQAKVLAKKLQPGKPDLRQGPRTTAKAPEDMNAWLRRATGHQRTP